MPVAVACPKCKKKYTLPDTMLGKPVKCTQCETQFRTPAPNQARQRQVDPRQLAKQQQAAAAARKQVGDLKKMGVDGPIHKAPDVFDGLSPMQGTADPLNNMALEDPGFADVRSQSIVADDSPDDPHAEMFSNPALGAVKKPKSKGGGRKRKSGNSWTQKVWIYILAVFIPIYVLSIIVTLLQLLPIETNNLVLAIVTLPFYLVTIVVSFWGVIAASHESTLHGILSLLIPFYIIVPVVKFWESMKAFAFAQLAVLGVVPFLIATIAVNIFRIASAEA